MKSILNTKVQQSKYGIGIITAIDENKIMTILFPQGEKRFQYPDSFCKSIQSEDEEIQQEAEDAWMKKLEEKQRKEAKEIAEKEEKIRKEVNEILKNTDESIQFHDTTYRLFIVHQGKTYFEELKGKYVWAPQSGIHHHEKMTDIHKGDIIFNYANGAIQAVSEALCDCFNSPIPSALYGNGWNAVGYRVLLRYQTLSNPISLDSIRTQIIDNRASMYSSFDSNGDACQGYMYELEVALAKLIKAEILAQSQSPGVQSVLSRIK